MLAEPGSLLPARYKPPTLRELRLGALGKCPRLPGLSLGALWVLLGCSLGAPWVLPGGRCLQPSSPALSPGRNPLLGAAPAAAPHPRRAERWGPSPPPPFLNFIFRATPPSPPPPSPNPRAYRNRGESLMHSSNSTVILAARSSAEEAHRPAAAQQGAAQRPPPRRHREGPAGGLPGSSSKSRFWLFCKAPRGFAQPQGGLATSRGFGYRRGVAQLAGVARF